MTDETRIRQRAIAGIIRGVAKKTALLTIGSSAAVLVYALFQDAGQRWWSLPASVLFGGALGLLNFRWLATAVERVYLRKGATPGLSSLAAAVISILKLSLIFIILFMVIKWRLLHIFGMVAGLSLSFLAILWEGAKLMNQTLRNGGSER
jgi:hypothetical protein